MKFSRVGSMYFFRDGRIEKSSKNLDLLKSEAIRCYAGNPERQKEIKKAYDDFVSKLN